MAEVITPYIKIKGSNLPANTMSKLENIEVDSSMGYPDSCTIAFIDTDSLDLIDSTYTIGDEIEVLFEGVVAGQSPKAVFKGEITSITPEFRDDFSATFVIKGYDKRHRLMRGTKTAAYINVKDSDIVSKIVGAAGLRASVDTTGIVREHVLQDNQTDLDFLHQLARRNGYVMSFDGTTLSFKKPATSGNIPLSWGEGLIAFRPRLSAARQVQEVIVLGWDPKTQKQIRGNKSSSKNSPKIGIGKTGVQISSVFGNAKRIVVHQPVADAKEADALAQAILDKIESEYIEAEGLAIGNPDLLAGKIVKIDKIGKRFSGTYHITSAKHYLQNGIYETEFRVEGATPYLLGGIFDTGEQHSSSNYPEWTGIYTAVVTNNNDPDKLGRVKVKYPWFSNDVESNWVRVIIPGAGKSRGSFWVPQVNDEVLVAFEHGNFNYPYVLGGLYSTKYPPMSDIGSSSKDVVTKKVWRSESGHIILMDDAKDSKKIELQTADGHVLTLDDKNKKIELKTKGGKGIVIDDQGNKITVSGPNTIEIKSNGGITIQGNGSVTVKGNGSVSVEGATVEVKGKGSVKVTAPMIQIG